MRILYIDMDSCRADHLGCYGYHRNTTPNIDRVAREAAVFTNCYVSDAPCLPSRSALFSGMFGFRNGVVAHSGTAQRMRYRGAGHRHDPHKLSFMEALAERAGLHTVTISSFGERHIAWDWYAGFREMHNSGRRGHDVAHETNRQALPWIRQNAQNDNWFLHLNYWDPHRPYRTPLEYGNPFEKEPAPSWPDAATIKKQCATYGPRSAAEPLGWDVKPWPREPQAVRNRADYKRWIDGFDTGIRYMDDHIGEVLQALQDAGVYDDLLIIFSADHGESQGELNVYGDHHTADLPTSRVPLIIRGPRGKKSGRQSIRAGRHSGFLYQLDLCPTLLEYLDCEAPAGWDGESFLPALQGQRWRGRDHLVFGQGAWSVQRSVRFGDYLYMRTYDAALHDWRPEMLFDVKRDPRETNDLMQRKPAVAEKGRALLQQWTEAVSLGGAEPVRDPFIDLLAEGGPLYTPWSPERYAEWLRKNGRHGAAKKLLADTRWSARGVESGAADEQTRLDIRASR